MPQAVREPGASQTGEAGEGEIRVERDSDAGDGRYRQLFDAIDQGFCVIEVLFDAAGRGHDYRFLETNPAFETQTGLQNASGKLCRDIVPGHEEHWFEIYGRIALSGKAERFEAPAAALGHEYEVFAFPFGEPALRRVGVLFNDISERKQAERTQRVLLAELNHRVKNTLAIVQSVARQSLRGVDKAVQDGFFGRLAAIARAQDMRDGGDGQSVRLAELVQKAVAPFDFPGPAGRVAAEGPDLSLRWEAAQSLALALHELATNAVKYGALSDGAGRVTVAWRLEPGDEARLILCWTERGGPEITVAPERVGFGTRMLKQVLAAQLDGEIDIAYDRGGVSVRLEAPATGLLAAE